MISEEPTRKLKKRLRDAGFTPRDAEGSHTVWTSQNGTTVTIPDGHKNISPGVVRQVNKAIEKSKKS